MNLRLKRCALVIPVGIALSACGGRVEESKATPTVKPKLPSGVVAFRVPEITEITDSQMVRSVVRGRAILEATRDSLPHNVGNSLRCASCHFSAGTARNALPWVGVYSRFPQYRPRSGHVDTIEDRINDCFERSMNGTALSAASPSMRDIVAYLAFLSRGVPAGAKVDGQGLPKLDPAHGDTTRGLAIYSGQCAHCHGVAGQGTVEAPPVWGPKAFNDGAGMSRINVLASFAHELMPLDRPRTLSVQQAYDVASYIDSRPRPTFAGREHDWPHDSIPADLGYPLRRGVTHQPHR
ncbi:MAG: c-type cytochrome [Gemmatimonadaceae bacterium]|nr:c-type cytochrome [Gemmatimonadaceae bacterium]